jgi:malonyl-CoA decarboxylase
VFYSISNCQAGLAGISFGNFLIKQVAKNIQSELPNIKDFVTLSPLPNFADWVLKTEAGTKALPSKNSSAKTLRPVSADNQEHPAVLLLKELAINNALCRNEDRQKEIEQLLMPLAAQYLLSGRSNRGQVYDPVARFHLGNGARLERINFMGDTSPKALLNAAGFMVNYYYDLEMVEQNHQAFIESNQIATSKDVSKLLPKTVTKKDKKS